MLAPRPRAGLIANDLADLGMTAETPPHPREPPSSTGVALGWVYVAEGSMLGGRIIRRRLSAAGSDLKGLSFLDPYGDQTGDRWRAFLTVLEQACADGTASIDQVVRGGVEAFAFAHATLSPAAVGAEA
jgi:heme oxygenase